MGGHPRGLNPKTYRELHYRVQISPLTAQLSTLRNRLLPGLLDPRKTAKVPPCVAKDSVAHAFSYFGTSLSLVGPT